MPSKPLRLQMWNRASCPASDNGAGSVDDPASWAVPDTLQQEVEVKVGTILCAHACDSVCRKRCRASRATPTRRSTWRGARRRRCPCCAAPAPPQPAWTTSPRALARCACSAQPREASGSAGACCAAAAAGCYWVDGSGLCCERHALQWPLSIRNFLVWCSLAGGGAGPRVCSRPGRDGRCLQHSTSRCVRICLSGFLRLHIISNGVFRSPIHAASSVPEQRNEVSGTTSMPQSRSHVEKPAANIQVQTQLPPYRLLPPAAAAGAGAEAGVQR